MGTQLAGFNLTIGQNGLSYQGVMCDCDLLATALSRSDARPRYNIPSVRGSHSDSSGT